MSKITVIRAAVSTPVGKTYQVCELAYKTDEGKTKGMKLFGFGAQKANYDVASKAAQGDVLEAQFRQNDKGYWEFSSLTSTGEKEVVQASAGAAHNAGATKSNWETSDERAARQVLIVRQSSLSSAVAFVEAVKQKATVEDVVGIAKVFEDFVFGKPQGKDVQ
jgi:hypothetical protein